MVRNATETPNYPAATLMSYKKARRVSESQVRRVKAPDATDTWCPIRHSLLIDVVHEQAASAGLSVIDTKYSMSPEGEQMFGVATLKPERGVYTKDAGVAIGFRNSMDKKFAAGLVFGQHVIVCDNMAFVGDCVISRKHTPEIIQDLPVLVELAMEGYKEIHQFNRRFIPVLKNEVVEVDDPHVHSLLIDSMDWGAITAAQIPHVLEEWRNPTFDYFKKQRNAWGVFNAFTYAMNQTTPNPLTGADRTKILTDLFCHHYEVTTADGRTHEEAACISEAA